MRNDVEVGVGRRGPPGLCLTVAPTHPEGYEHVMVTLWLTVASQCSSGWVARCVTASQWLRCWDQVMFILSTQHAPLWTKVMSNCSIWCFLKIANMNGKVIYLLKAFLLHVKRKIQCIISKLSFLMAEPLYRSSDALSSVLLLCIALHIVFFLLQS